MTWPKPCAAHLPITTYPCFRIEIKFKEGKLTEGGQVVIKVEENDDADSETETNDGHDASMKTPKPVKAKMEGKIRLVGKNNDGRRTSSDCGLCGKGFSNPRYLQLHRERMHLPRERKTCPICSRNLASELGLTRHIRSVHHGEKSEACNVCGRRFVDERMRKEHENAVHQQEKKFKCEACEKTFGWSSSLTKHRKTCFEKDE